MSRKKTTAGAKGDNERRAVKTVAREKTPQKGDPGVSRSDPVRWRDTELANGFCRPKKAFFKEVKRRVESGMNKLCRPRAKSGVGPGENRTASKKRKGVVRQRKTSEDTRGKKKPE